MFKNKYYLFIDKLKSRERKKEYEVFNFVYRRNGD